MLHWDKYVYIILILLGMFVEYKFNGTFYVGMFFTGVFVACFVFLYDEIMDRWIK